VESATVSVTDGSISSTGSDRLPVVVSVGAATTLAYISGNNQGGALNAILASPFVVKVTDAYGNPVSGTTVDFAILSVPGGASGQSLSNPQSPATASSGMASNTLTLGNALGTYTVTATASGLGGSPVTFSAQAGFIKAAIGGDLTAAASWNGGNAPGASDVATWVSGSLGGATLTLPSDTSWGGISMTAASSDPTIPAGQTLTLGSSGIDLSSSANNMTIAAAVALGASQSWAVNSNKTLTVSGNIGGAGMSLTKSGLGILTLTGTNTFGGGMNILNGTVSLSTNNSAGTGTITLGDDSGADSATLYNGGAAGSVLVITNDISVAAGSSGTLSILGNNNYITNSGSLTLGNNLTVSSGNVGKTIYFTGTTTETSLTPLTIINTNSLTTFTGPLGVSSGGLTFAHHTTVALTIGPGNITGIGPVTFNANSSGAFTVSAASINNSASITNGGTGTGTTTISGVIGSSVTSVVQNGPNSTLTLNNAANAFIGGLYILAGTVADGGIAGALGPSGSTIYIGDATVGADATLLAGGNGGPIDTNNPIIVVAGAGARTIDQPAGANWNGGFAGAITLNNNLTLTASTHWNKGVAISGNISGTGNLTLKSGTYQDAGYRGGVVTVSSPSINFTGAITNSGGTGINTMTISGSIGTNVTAVVQNSTAPLLLSGTNTFHGPTTINAGTLALGVNGSISNSANISIAAGATFDVSLKATYVLSTNLTASSAAIIKGNVAGTVNFGSHQITVNYDGSQPLSISQGTLQLNGNAFIINGGVLPYGTYVLVQASGPITGSGSYALSGTAVDAAGDSGKSSFISVVGSQVLLTVHGPGTVYKVR